MYSPTLEIERPLTVKSAPEGAKTAATSISKGAMVHLTHSALHWRLRCINDTSSDDENTPSNVRSSKQEDTGGTISDIGTATPRSLTPAQSKPRPKTAPDYFIASASGDPATISTASKNKQDASSSPRRASCSPRVCCTVLTLAAAASLTTAASLPSDGFVPARCPWRVAHLHEQYNPLVTIFLTVQPFGWSPAPTGFMCKSRRCDPRREVDVGAGVLLLTKFRAQHVEVALLQQLLKIQGVLVVKTAASLVCWM
ncbi:hypothetical protein PC116_g14585 [Phytophthora cactorum]|uniref:Uncharacterized protein n=3 Tax=Phytophthora cactorum TaxID=29920 RepID=A0A8T1FAH7_9STRA|nr:hypothetical protein PC112_g20345 [Phytophthora cactorum]KAG2801021.1 hypothetical protein PC111_g19720 [Phytophthora cactorum]KAG2965265.1 hypothetical protein PC118_g19852 [Phytophthora cactorum]KAG2978894.1 hypothetical protein PC119_g21642 [Phytophthora cactorum]KAG3059237.1 hypothetical protein PC122_g20393 [Phytophthora cactorum]